MNSTFICDCIEASSSAVMSSYTEFSEENIFEITQRVEMVSCTVWHVFILIVSCLAEF